MPSLIKILRCVILQASHKQMSAKPNEGKTLLQTQDGEDISTQMWKPIASHGKTTTS